MITHRAILEVRIAAGKKTADNFSSINVYFYVERDKLMLL